MSDEADEVIDRLGAPVAATRAIEVMKGVATLLLAVAVVILAVAVSSANAHARHNQDVTDCRALFAANITDEQKSSSDAVAQILVELVRSIVNRPAGTPFDPAGTNAAIDAKDVAQVRYGLAIKARNDWVAAGTPLPCPVDSGG